MFWRGKPKKNFDPDEEKWRSEILKARLRGDLSDKEYERLKNLLRIKRPSDNAYKNKHSRN